MKEARALQHYRRPARLSREADGCRQVQTAFEECQDEERVLSEGGASSGGHGILTQAVVPSRFREASKHRDAASDKRRAPQWNPLVYRGRRYPFCTVTSHAIRSFQHWSATASEL